jgi:5-methylcytosine-specific restriction endonuclease McrA
MVKVSTVILAFLLVSSIAHPKSINYCSTCERDKHGHIKRNPVAKKAFRLEHPCPSTGHYKGHCKGYVVDHIVPLKRGGKDAPSNMQWQTKEDSRTKDAIE